MTWKKKIDEKSRESCEYKGLEIKTKCFCIQNKTENKKKNSVNNLFCVGFWSVTRFVMHLHASHFIIWVYGENYILFWSIQFIVWQTKKIILLNSLQLKNKKTKTVCESKFINNKSINYLFFLISSVKSNTWIQFKRRERERKKHVYNRLWNGSVEAASVCIEKNNLESGSKLAESVDMFTMFVKNKRKLYLKMLVTDYLFNHSFSFLYVDKNNSFKKKTDKNNR